MAHARRTYCTARELHALEELARGRVVLELGTWLGHSALAMANTAERVYTVDAYQPSPEWAGRDVPGLMLRATERLRGAGLVVPLLGRFAQVLPLLDPRAFGLVFVDGYHDRESQRQQYLLTRRFTPFLEAYAVHDWGVLETAEAAEGLLRPPDRVVDTLAVWQPSRGPIHT